MISLTCGILKNGVNELIYNTEIESQTQEKKTKNKKKTVVAKGKRMFKLGVRD